MGVAFESRAFLLWIDVLVDLAESGSRLPCCFGAFISEFLKTSANHGKKPDIC